MDCDGACVSVPESAAAFDDARDKRQFIITSGVEVAFVKGQVLIELQHTLYMVTTTTFEVSQFVELFKLAASFFTSSNEHM